MELIIKNIRLLVLFLCLPLVAQENISGTEVIIHTINNDADINLSNRYGEIQIQNWKKDSIKVVISYSYTADKKDRVNRIKSGISFEKVITNSYAQINTIFGKTNNNFSNENFSLHRSIENSDVSIRYKVYIPEGVTLSVQNKFGDIYFGDIKGDVEVRLSHGNLRGNKITGRLNATVKYGQINLNSLNYAVIELNHSNNGNIQYAKKLILNSSFSKLSISKVDFLKLRSKKDKVFIQEVNTLNGSSSMSKIHIAQLNKNINLTSNLFGHTDIDLVKSGFEGINIKSSNNKINIIFDSSCSFNTDITLKNAELIHSNSYKNLTTVLTGKKTKNITGIVGQNNKTNSSVNITIESSTLTLNNL